MKIEKTFDYTLEPTEDISEAYCGESREGGMIYYRIKSKIHSGWKVTLEDNDELYRDMLKAQSAEPYNHVLDYPEQWERWSKLFEIPCNKLIKLLKLRQLLPFSHSGDCKKIYFNHL